MPLSDSQIALRSEGIGASEAAAVLGLSPWATPWDVFARKRGLVPPFEGNRATAYGNHLEPFVVRLYQEDRGLEAMQLPVTMRHPEHPCIMATPDAFVLNPDNPPPPGVRVALTDQRWGADTEADEALVRERLLPHVLKGLEIKCTRWRMAARIGTPEEPNAPDEHLVQTAQGMIVCDLPAWDLAYWIGGEELRVLPFRRDPAFDRLLLGRIPHFWQHHIVGDRPPEIGASKSACGWLKSKFPSDDGTVIEDPDDELCSLVERWSEALDERDEVVERSETIANQIREAMANASRALDPEGRWKLSYKRTKDRERTDWKSLAHVLLDRLRAAGILEHQEAVALRDQHTTTSPGSRTLRKSGALFARD